MGEILTEKQYIYVEVSTGEIKLICIPVREEQGDDFSAGTGKAPGRTSAAPLPLIPPEPRGDMPGDIFIEKPAERKSRWWRRKSSEGKKKREQENILIPPIPLSLIHILAVLAASVEALLLGLLLGGLAIAYLDLSLQVKHQLLSPGCQLIL